MLILPIVFTGLALTQYGSATASYGSTNPPRGITRNGTYVGQALPQFSQEIFLGIPFASAPRLHLPRTLNNTWNGTRPATEFGLTCAGFGTNNQQNWPVGEDCLNLNIVRPRGTRLGDRLPVLVWIYGGGFSQGAIRDPEFNTSFMVQTSVQLGIPVIAVSLNYRLSGFGFLNSKEIQDEGVSNLALRDVWKGLEWLKENLEGFGGDPKKVTLWGESAGATIISYLTAAYRGNNSGLFRGAIISSGILFSPATAFLARYTIQQSLYNAVVSLTGCSNATRTLQCLRDLPFETLNSSLSNLQNFLPTVDGDFLQDSPLKQFATNQIAPINLVLGGTSDEGLFFGPNTYNTTEQLAAAVEGSIGINDTIGQELLQLYPLDGPNPPYSVNNSVDWIKETASVGVPSGIQTRRSYAIFGDLVFIAGRRKMAAGWKLATGKRAYSFRFDTDPTRFPLVVTPGLGVGFAQHGSDLSWQFRLPYISPTPYPPIPNVAAMKEESYAMQAAWISFAATGDPNRHGLGWISQWPSYEKGRPVNFVFNATLENKLNLHVEQDDYRQEGIVFINNLNV